MEITLHKGASIETLQAIKAEIMVSEDIDYINEIKLQAETIGTYFKQDIEKYNEMMAIVLEARRRRGELLLQMEKSKNRFCSGTNSYRYNDIPKAEASRDQRIAQIPRDLFEKELETAMVDMVKLSTNRLVKLHKKIEREKKERDYTTSGSGSVALYHCGVSELKNFIEPNSIDFIITDPPYPKEFVDLYGDLAEFGAYALKDGGSLVAMCGQSYINKIMKLMDLSLSYHWMISYDTPGGTVQIFTRNAFATWKPLLWYAKGEYTGDWVSDKVVSASNDKEHHHWGQSESGMWSIVKRFARAGQTVCDPFLGGGTTGVVCVENGINFVGCDVDENCIETFRSRIDG